MNNKKNIGLSIGGIIILVVVFFGGVSYGKNQTPTATKGTQAFGQNGIGGGQRGGRNNGGFINGQIISKDANSITVELRALGQNGDPNSQGGVSTSSGSGSKIIFYTDKTTISKTITGTLADLTIGEQVNINGAPNTDGSVNAQTIQIRPNIPTSVLK